MQGGLNEQIRFPAWFGKNSSQTKFSRFLSEIGDHLRSEAGVDRADLRMNYLPMLRAHLCGPLVQKGTDGAEDVIQILDHYHLSRDDWTSINELCQLSGHADPMKSIETKVKTAFTRAYNKGTHIMNYAEDVGGKKKKRKAVDTVALGADEDIEGLMDDDDDDDDDA